MTQQATETVLNANGDETIQSTEWMKWQYDFSTKMKLRYAVDVAKTNGDCTDNFVKSIRMCPNGCSFLYSLEDGTVRQCVSDGLLTKDGFLFLVHVLLLSYTQNFYLNY